MRAPKRLVPSAASPARICHGETALEEASASVPSSTGTPAPSLPIAAGLILLAPLLSGPPAHARICRVDLIPNGHKLACLTCHTRPAGGEDRNPFGKVVLAIVGGSRCTDFWGPELAAADSDGDGRTNGDELGDPGGAWKRGDPSPGDPALVTPPGVDEVAFPPLEILSVEPAQVSTRGGTPVKVRGANFTDRTVIRIGAMPLADQVVVDAARIDGVAPAMDPRETPGPRDVTAEDERGAALFAGGASYVVPRAGEGRLLRGDVDSDGTVEVSDAITLLRHLLDGGARPSSFPAADADESAGVDISDAVFILHLWSSGGSRGEATERP